jgi:2-polyprenyl-3-methyl-5-hydroxy-6-metoxy-1,4-benzoquinol methylase
MKYSIGKTSGVFIGDESVVKIFNIRNKALKPSRGTYQDCWDRETTCLTRLKGELHFPQLIETYSDILGIKMTTAGESLFYTWQEHDLMLYLDQANRIADTLEKHNIKYFHVGMDGKAKVNKQNVFPLSNFCIEDGEISIIDFEMACPVGSEAESNMSDRFKELYANYNPNVFRQTLIDTLKDPKPCYEAELVAKLPDKNKIDIFKDRNPREVYKSMTTFTQPSEKIVKEWRKYQKRFGKDQAVDRVQKMNLPRVCGSDKTVVDIGCNDGYISMLVAPMVASVTGVEPHVELTEDKPANVTWVRNTFNEFLASNQGTFDVLLSLAVSIQLRDFGGLTEQEIVNGYYSLLPVGGVVVHETQKLENRPNNQEHTTAMIDAFKTKFVQIEHGDARGSGKREYYHFRKEA